MKTISIGRFDREGDSMKYVLLTAAAAAIVFGIGFLLTGLIRRKMKNKPPLWAHILLSLGAGVLIFCAVGFGYLSIHYPAQEEALAVLSETNGAQAAAIDGGYFIDGPGEDAALIFYPGAKVDAEAYLPLLRQTAEKGVDCFLLKAPMRMPIFDKNAADRIISGYTYDTWLLGGHSMGGTVAADYAAEHRDTVDGAVLLAAYPTEKLSDSTGLLSVYGTQDQVLDREAYENAKQYFPSGFTEIIIDGGNHAQFGCYGEQKGDGKAAVSEKEQQSQTAFSIAEFANKLLNKAS